MGRVEHELIKAKGNQILWYVGINKERCLTILTTYLFYKNEFENDKVITLLQTTRGTRLWPDLSKIVAKHYGKALSIQQL